METQSTSLLRNQHLYNFVFGNIQLDVCIGIRPVVAQAQNRDSHFSDKIVDLSLIDLVVT